MGSTGLSSSKPHAVCIPFPAQGHINPMLKLAKLLHHKGFHITFVNTEFNHQRLLKSRGPQSLDGLPSFRFETIPDGLPPSNPDATQGIPDLCESTTSKCLAPFKELLGKLNDTSSSNVPPVTCIVSDGIMSFTVAAAEELGIPEIFFWTASACGFYGYVQYPKLIERGLIPLKGTCPISFNFFRVFHVQIYILCHLKIRRKYCLLVKYCHVRESNNNMGLTILIIRECLLYAWNVESELLLCSHLCYPYILYANI